MAPVVVRGIAPDLDAFAAALAGVPVKLRPALRAATIKSAGELVTTIRANAAWSDDIPQAVRVRTSFSQARPGVQVLVDRKRAPYARAMEGTRGQSTFRHPVFGNRNVWVDQPTRPFFFPAVRAAYGPTVAAIRDALITTLPIRR